MVKRFRLLSFCFLFTVVTQIPVLGGAALPASRLVTDWGKDSYVHLIAKRKIQAASRSSSALIRNFRFHKHADHTRLVVDLTQRADYVSRRTDNPDHVIIQFNNTILGKQARAKLRKKGFPRTIKLSESKARRVKLTIDIQSLAEYKLFTLTKPHRLVLDLYPLPSQPPHVNGTTPKANNQSPSPPPSPQVAKPRPGDDLLIVLDPGHGGKDPGALGRRGTREKDIVLKIAKRLRAMIRKELSGAKVLMTREKDVFIELEDRAEFANDKNADLFVSIHINSHPKRSVRGLELYHFGEASDPRALEVAARENGTPLQENGPAWQFILADKLNDKKIEESQELAWTTKKSLVGRLQKHYNVKDHGVKTAPFFVLRMTTMPSILAEIAFVSNPTEEKLLKSQTYQRRVAEGIFEGIKAYVIPLQTASR